jgi:hypothetical protein
LTVTLKERFLRACGAANTSSQASIFQMILNLEAMLRDPQRHRGAGLRKPHPSSIWETRVGFSLRALFLLRHDEAIFVFLGTHDEVKRFLRGL